MEKRAIVEFSSALDFLLAHGFLLERFAIYRLTSFYLTFYLADFLIERVWRSSRLCGISENELENVISSSKFLISHLFDWFEQFEPEEMESFLCTRREPLGNRTLVSCSVVDVQLKLAITPLILDILPPTPRRLLRLLTNTRWLSRAAWCLLTCCTFLTKQAEVRVAAVLICDF